MLRFVLRRMAVAVPLLFISVTFVFLIFALIPGDPALNFAGDYAGPEAVARIRERFGLDKPVLVRYGTYLRQLGRGDLGVSIFTGIPVTREIRSRFLQTLKLAVSSLVLAVVIGITAGVIAALRQGSFIDHFATVVALAGISIPGFWLGLLLIYFFSVRLHMLPTGGAGTWSSIILPTISLSVFSVAYIARITRSALLEIVAQDYVRTARAKGLPASVVTFKHALTNAALPLVTVIGLRLGVLMTGSVVTESVFAWPGLGRLMVTAVNNRDYPVAQGVLLTFAVTFVFVNLIVDIAYSFLDPRIRYT